MQDVTRQLVTKLAEGDTVSLERLLEHYLPELHAYVRLQTGARILAQESSADLVQSVCREVLEGYDDFEYQGEIAFKRWLFLHAARKIADRGRHYGYECRDVARNQSFSAAQVASGYRAFVSPTQHAIRQEDVDQLEQAFEKLTEQQREVIVCAKILEMSHEEIASRLGTTTNATRVALHKAMVRLAFLMERPAD